MNEPVFLEPDVVMFLHDQSVREYGGYHGVRDEALLASALNRARNRLGYEPDSDFSALAACYAFGIAKNYTFVDGHKRTAWTCCKLFLKVSGADITADPVRAEENMVALATGEMSEAGFAAWLRAAPPRQAD